MYRSLVKFAVNTCMQKLASFLKIGINTDNRAKRLKRSHNLWSVTSNQLHYRHILPAVWPMQMIQRCIPVQIYSIADFNSYEIGSITNFRQGYYGHLNTVKYQRDSISTSLASYVYHLIIGEKALYTYLSYNRLGYPVCRPTTILFTLLKGKPRNFKP